MRFSRSLLIVSSGEPADAQSFTTIRRFGRRETGMRARELKRCLTEAEQLKPTRREQALANLQGRCSPGFVVCLLSGHAP